MPIAICPNCQSSLDIPAALFRGTVRCANCLEPFDPSSGIPVVPTVSTPEARRVTSGRREISRRPRSRLWLVVLLAGCSLIALVCVGSCIGFINVWTNPPFKPYTAADNSYTAIVPGDPLPITRMDGQGRNLTGVEVKRDFPEEQYFIEWVDEDDAPKGKKALTPKGVVDEWISRNRANVISADAQKSHHGLEASEANGQVSLTQGNFVIRAVKAGDRVYLIGITGGVMPGSRYAERYLDGFVPKGAKPEQPLDIEKP